MVDRGARGLLAVEHAQATIETLLPQIVQRLIQVREGILAHVAPFYGYSNQGRRRITSLPSRKISFAPSCVRAAVVRGPRSSSHAASCTITCETPTVRRPSHAVI